MENRENIIYSLFQDDDVVFIMLLSAFSINYCLKPKIVYYFHLSNFHYSTFEIQNNFIHFISLTSLAAKFNLFTCKLNCWLFQIEKPQRFSLWNIPIYYLLCLHWKFERMYHFTLCVLCYPFILDFDLGNAIIYGKKVCVCKILP